MITYYHNPRCSKSREGLVFLEARGQAVKVVNYKETPLRPDELLEIIDALGIEAMDVVRTKEKLWKEQFSDKELDEEELVLLMIEHPELMERPIAVNGDKAAIGRPTENLEKVL
ncbi:MAG: arsenate reductase (glutaredoxin) [Schleiferiaceae bacterium]|nr:arsenate reductase (glutaredoxin) [Schleiferiaceae bacterium]